MSKPSIQAVLFDLDGVLVDTPRYHAIAWQTVLSSLGGSITEEMVFLNEGRKAEEILIQLLNEVGLSPSAADLDLLVEKKREYFRRIAKVHFYPHTLDVIRKLKSWGMQLAIVSGCAKSSMQNVLTESQKNMFDLIQTSDDVPKAKPNPEPYDLARKKLKIKREACLAVENAPLGITSAKRAGMMCVAVESTLGREYLKEADYVIPNIGALLALPVFNHKTH